MDAFLSLQSVRRPRVTVDAHRIAAPASHCWPKNDLWQASRPDPDSLVRVFQVAPRDDLFLSLTLP